MASSINTLRQNEKVHPLIIAGRIIVLALLTLLTQIGGIVYLMNIALYKIIDKQIKGKWQNKSTKLFSFIILYNMTTFLVVPPIAKHFGRVPISANNNLKPLTIWTILLNRNYVKPQLRDAAYSVANKMAEKYPGNVVNYLDANFPFFNGFGLPPHLSHNDGKKLDLSFCYNNATTNEPTNDGPSFIGYGICEEPKPGEVNSAANCGQQGYWQYSLLRKIVPQGSKDHFTFNEQKTRDLVLFFAAQQAIGKIFIEPHLKTRLKLTTEKIRFHGCHAVRHDDHVHVQLR